MGVVADAGNVGTVVVSDAAIKATESIGHAVAPHQSFAGTENRLIFGSATDRQDAGQIVRGSFRPLPTLQSYMSFFPGELLVSRVLEPFIEIGKLVNYNSFGGANGLYIPDDGDWRLSYGYGMDNASYIQYGIANFTSLTIRAKLDNFVIDEFTVTPDYQAFHIYPNPGAPQARGIANGLRLVEFPAHEGQLITFDYKVEGHPYVNGWGSSYAVSGVFSGGDTIETVDLEFTHTGGPDVISGSPGAYFLTGVETYPYTTFTAIHTDLFYDPDNHIYPFGATGNDLLLRQFGTGNFVGALDFPEAGQVGVDLYLPEQVLSNGTDVSAQAEVGKWHTSRVISGQFDITAPGAGDLTVSLWFGLDK